MPKIDLLLKIACIGNWHEDSSNFHKFVCFLMKNVLLVDLIQTMRILLYKKAINYQQN